MILNTAAAAHLSTFAPLVDKVMLQEMRDLIAPEELLAMASNSSGRASKRSGNTWWPVAPARSRRCCGAGA